MRNQDDTVMLSEIEASRETSAPGQTRIAQVVETAQDKALKLVDADNCPIVFLEQTSDRPLRLRSGESSITLLPNGKNILEGKTITQAADNLRLRAPVIEAN